MPYCPNCGNEVSPDTTFCPKCGAALNPNQPRYGVPATTHRYGRDEKSEQREKNEKDEKNEKAEKSEKSESGPFRYLGPIIGGLILIILGVVFLFPEVMQRQIWAFSFLAIGVIIIIGAIYMAKTSKKRNPQTYSSQPKNNL